MTGAPWEPTIPAGTHRVACAIGGIAYRGRWCSAAQAEAEVVELVAQGLAVTPRVESRDEVLARLATAEQARISSTRAWLEQTHAPTMAEIEQAEAEAVQAHRVPVVCYPGADDDAPPYASIKQAIGDYAAHCHGPMLAQIRPTSRADGSHGAWIVVGSALSSLGLLPGDPRRDRILRWACSADDRDGAAGRPRLGGTDWDVLRRLRSLLESAGALRRRLIR